MPNGKPAGVTCVQLTSDRRCRLFGSPERPAVCDAFQAMADACGSTRDEALTLLTIMEVVTAQHR